MRQYDNVKIKSARVETITPERATEMLKHNVGNRPISKTYVGQFIRIIKSGGWVTTSQGIALYENGNIHDGQHRLTAISLAGIPVDVLVVTFHGEGTAQSLPTDMGKRRSISNVTGISRDRVEIINLWLNVLLWTKSRNDPRVIETIHDIAAPALDAFDLECGSTTRPSVSTASVRAAFVLRRLDGVNAYPIYKAMVLSRYGELTKKAGFLLKRLESYKNNTGIDYRRSCFITTWAALDPSRNDDSNFAIPKPEYEWNDAKQVFENIFLDAITTPNGDVA